MPTSLGRAASGRRCNAIRPAASISNSPAMARTRTSCARLMVQKCIQDSRNQADLRYDEFFPHEPEHRDRLTVARASQIGARHAIQVGSRQLPLAGLQRKLPLISSPNVLMKTAWESNNEVFGRGRCPRSPWLGCAHSRNGAGARRVLFRSRHSATPQHAHDRGR